MYKLKKKIMDVLSSKNVEFNTYAEKNEKRQSFIVRGLNYGDDSQNISFIGEALVEAGIVGQIEITRHLTGHMRRNLNAEHNVLYRFVIGHDENISGITGIKSINGFRVVIEKMRKSTVIQCKRCQRFQHTTASCSFNYRCVQCSNHHAPGECPRLKNDKLPLQCCNCVAAGYKNFNHTANNLNKCEFFKSKHSQLFDKFQKSVAVKSSKSRVNNNNDLSNFKSTAADLLATPAPANNPRLKVDKKKTVNTPNINAANLKRTGYKSNGDRSRSFEKSTFVNSGESHTVSAISDDKLHALAVALVQVLKQFL